MSGIYIKMPMPTVPQTVIIYPDGTVADVYDGEKYNAIPVPDHGRLIDADALIRRIRAEGINQAEQLADRRHPVVMSYGDCYGKCKEAPTIIPADKE